jgi:CubicO group peptidase (beta-lactamase class C family)
MKRWSRSIPAFVFVLLMATAASAQEVQRLEPGETYRHTLGVDESRTYELILAADWFVSGRVMQDGVDVAVTVRGPDGEQVARFASAVGVPGPESFQFSTEAAGPYRLEVAPAKSGEAGSYRLRVERSEPVATTPEGRLDQAMARFGEDTPGAIVAVIRGGEVDVVRSYGLANLTYGVPFTEHAPTNIGSTSKQFTGFALALLQARGELSLDDDVRDYLPELVDFGETITLRHLLSHTSGYREFVNTLLMGGRQILEGDYIDRDEVLEVIRRQPRLQNAPGTEFNYNNTAFSLLTLVVERVTGRPFPEWMAEEVFGPLGMESTVVRAHPGQIVPGSTMGYIPGEGGFREVRDIPASMGAGGIYTTVGDLARWMGNFATGELGGEGVIREMTTPYVLANGDTTNYGLGLFMDEQGGLRRWQHGGNDVAHSSTFVYYPELDAGYVVLSNYGGMPGSVGRLVAEAFFPTEADPTTVAGAPEAAPDGATEVTVSPELLQRYAGRYELAAAPGVVLSLTVTDGALRLELPGQPEYPLRSTSDSTFTVEGLDGIDARLTFHRSGEGDVDALTFHQNGDHRATRVAEVAEVVDLAEYAGLYFSDELETFYRLEVEEGQLVIHHRRFAPARLEYAGDDTFTGTLPVTRLEFERDEDGRVAGFHAGNVRARDIWFERQAPR